MNEIVNLLNSGHEMGINFTYKFKVRLAVSCTSVGFGGAIADNDQKVVSGR